MRDKRVYAVVAAVGVLGVILGSFLPWVRFTGPFGQFAKIGLEDDSDGIITLALGAVAVWGVASYYFERGRGLAQALLSSPSPPSIWPTRTVGSPEYSGTSRRWHPKVRPRGRNSPSNL